MGCHTVTFKSSVPPSDEGADRLQTVLTAPLIRRPVEHDIPKPSRSVNIGGHNTPCHNLQKGYETVYV